MGCLGSRQSKDSVSKVVNYLQGHLNFYRIHILFFTFTPLICSAIFYASNGANHISYIDSLFLCVSSITVCGLATADLSSLTTWQQVLLFLQMCLGSPVVVSWVMVYVRRNMFRSRFRHLIEAELSQRMTEKMNAPVEVETKPWWKRAARVLSRPHLSIITEHPTSTQASSEHERGRGRSLAQRLHPDMIRRMDDAPKLVDPSGFISEGQAQQPVLSEGQMTEEPLSASTTPEAPPPSANARQLAFDVPPSATQSVSDETDIVVEQELEHKGDIGEVITRHNRSRRLTDPGNGPPNGVPFQRFRTTNVGRDDAFPRTQTIEFAPDPHRALHNYNDRFRRGLSPTAPTRSPQQRGMSLPRQPSISRPTISIPHTTTTHTHRSQHVRTKHRGFGGFPMPHEIINAGVNQFFPNFKRQLTRTVTIPRTQTIVSQRGGSAPPPPGSKPVPYISFEAIVGRNSEFRELTDEQLEEIGGVEYRALTALLWIVASYHIGWQLLSFTVIAPYMSIGRWRQEFEPPALHRKISSTWFSIFQVVSSYTNTGMSLEDASMVPFQRAYPMIIFMVLLILAGNTAFPIFLRFQIWIISKLTPKDSRLNETLHFLLDHPRRCFVYLFPSHQTWFLLTVVLSLSITDWFFFLVLDIGNPAIESIPTGIRVIIGLLQATAVRAAGFGTVTMSALAPAVKVLYVVMMYISVYPVAMSIRSTNVYEEKSLGIFEDDESLDEDNFVPRGNRATIWSNYLAMHMRRQLSFDMWWIGLALFLLCIIERDGIDDPNTLAWFNIFTILFELVSAYATVGLSLGVSYANYSFSGVLRPLSKLIICAVMLRGRHRGLPVAIDRAVILPFEFQQNTQEGPHEDEPANVDPFSLNRRRGSVSVSGSGYDHGDGTGNGHSLGILKEKASQEDVNSTTQRRSWKSNSVGRESVSSRRSERSSNLEV